MRDVPSPADVSADDGLQVPTVFCRAVKMTACVFAAAIAGVAHAAAPGVTMRAVLRDGAVRGAFDSGGVAPLALVIRVAGDRQRVDFSDGRGHREHLVSRDGAADAWLIEDGTGHRLPVPHSFMGANLMLHPRSFCRVVTVICHKAGARVISGRPATAWRYFGAGHRGPGHSDAGKFWVDDASGMLLGFKSTDASGDRHVSMTVLSVSTGPLPSRLFSPDAAHLPHRQDR